MAVYRHLGKQQQKKQKYGTAYRIKTKLIILKKYNQYNTT